MDTLLELLLYLPMLLNKKQPLMGWYLNFVLYLLHFVLAEVMVEVWFDSVLVVDGIEYW